jgi:hypothetical protein
MTGPYGGYQPPSHDTYPQNLVPRQPGPPVRPPAYQPGTAAPVRPAWPPAATGGYGSPPPRPPRRSRKVLWLVLGGVVLVVLALVIVFVVPPLVSAARDANTTISAPARAGGLTKQTGGGGLSNVSLSDPSLKNTVSAVYQGAAGTPGVYLFGGTTTDFAPGTLVDTFFRQLNSAGMTVSDRASFDDGALDGQLECAKVVAQSQTFGTCGWADHGGLVATLSPNQTPQQIAKTTQAMLPDVVKVG